MRKYLALLACLAAVPLAGCSFSAGSGDDAGPMSKSELEDRVADDIEPDDPDADVTADCAGELAAKKDASQDCHLKIGDESADVHVVVTEVDGDAISDWRLDTYVPGDTLGEAIKTSLVGQGINADTVDCPDDLPGEEGATVHCAVTAGQQQGDAEVKVDNVDGLMVHFNYKVR